MLHVLLDVPDHQPSIELVPAPVEVLGDRAELDYQIVRQVVRFGLAPFFPPQTEQGALVVPHDDPGVGSAEEIAPAETLLRLGKGPRH